METRFTGNRKSYNKPEFCARVYFEIAFEAFQGRYSWLWFYEITYNLPVSIYASMIFLVNETKSFLVSIPNT